MSQELDLTATVEAVAVADARVGTVEVHTTVEGGSSAQVAVEEESVSATVDEVPSTDAQFEVPEIFVIGSAVVGPQGPQGPPGGEVVSGWWNYSTLLNPPPKQGEIRTTPDPVVTGESVTVYLSATDADGLYWSAPAIKTDDELILRGTAGSVLHCQVVNFELTQSGPDGYATIDTVLLSGVGQIAKNARVNVGLVRAAAAGVGGSDVAYIHNQVAPSDIWVIDHSLGKYPSVMVVDTGGSTLEPDIHYNSSIQITIVFSSATSGKAYLN